MQRGEYAAIHRALIDDPDFRRLDPPSKLLVLTLKILLGASGIDLVRCHVTQLLALTGLEESTLRASLDTLVSHNWLLAQDDVLWLRNGLRFNPNLNLENAKHKTGICNHLDSLPRLAIVNAFSQYYGLPEIATRMGIEWVSIPYAIQVSVSVAVDVKGSVSSLRSETGASANVEKSGPDANGPAQRRPESPLQIVMGGIRKLGYECNDQDGSVAIAMLRKGLMPDRILDAAEGQAVLVKAGRVEAPPRLVRLYSDELNGKIDSFWRACESARLAELKRAPASAVVRAIGDGAA